MSSNLVVRIRNQNENVRKLRYTGFVPGIIYGNHKDPVMVSVQEKELAKECSESVFFNTVLDLNLNSQNEKVLPKKISYHPVTGRVLHIDFMRISKGTKIKAFIPVEAINEDKAPGIKKGGIVNLVVHKLECFVEPESIPEKIELDLSGKEIGENVLLESLNLPAGCKAVNAERDAVLATIVVSKVGAEEKTQPTEGEEASKAE